jgi:hypothetical protein
MTYEEYERLRAPLLKALAEAAEQYRLNTAPLYDQLLRLSAMMPRPSFQVRMAELSDEALAAISQSGGHWTTPSVPDAHGLTQAELACATPAGHPFCGYDTGCPFCG